MEPKITIQENEATQLLRVRYIAAYYNYVDARTSRGVTAYNQSVFANREEKLAKQFSQWERPPKPEDITRAYNRLIAEETEELIKETIWTVPDDKTPAARRAEIEADIIGTMMELFDVFHTGKKG